MSKEKQYFVRVIHDQTQRSIKSLKHIMQCIPDEVWKKKYCGMPLWKHIYHTLHSLDKAYMNPNQYDEPSFHSDGLENLDIESPNCLSRECLSHYLLTIEKKITDYLETLQDEELVRTPADCPHTRFRLILGQHRHLDMHIGMLMGYIVAETGLWPRIIMPHEPFPGGNYETLLRPTHTVQE